MVEGYLEIDSDGIASAAAKYETESTKFDELLVQIKSDFDDIMASWDDASKEEWSTRVTSAKESLDNISAMLKTNAKVLNQISSLAKDAEAKVKAAVASM